MDEVEDKRQTGVEYRGVTLPEGMTPLCLDEMASLFNDFADGLLAVDGKEADHRDAAVKAFVAARRCLVSRKASQQ